MSMKILYWSLAVIIVSMIGIWFFQQNHCSLILNTKDDGYQIYPHKVCYVTRVFTGKSRALNLHADPKTFRVLAPILYAKDKNQVWYWEHPIEGADAKTFLVLTYKAYSRGTRVSVTDDLFSKDESTVYVAGKPFVPSDKGPVDVISFSSLSNDYEKDKNAVYCRDRFTVRDPQVASSFKMIGNKYATDGKLIYYSCFEPLKDKSRGTYVDPHTFVYLGSGSVNDYGMDKVNIYKNDEVISHQDDISVTDWNEFLTNDAKEKILNFLRNK